MVEPTHYERSIPSSSSTTFNLMDKMKIDIKLPFYDGTPGPRGVTNKNGALMDITLPHNIATELEYDIHTNAGQLAAQHPRVAIILWGWAIGSCYHHYTNHQNL
jgi:hypothetical protein